MRLLSWNVNGYRAVLKKGFLKWLGTERPDVLCLQETKVAPYQLQADASKPKGYHTFFTAPQKKGYSGVATFSLTEPSEVEMGLGIDRLDAEGRVIASHFGRWVLLNVYFPNGKKDRERLTFKMDFYRSFLEKAEDYRRKGKEVIFCGDVNTAHKEIDLSHPKDNERISGFLPIEREWIDKVVSLGYIDTFREFHPEPEHYTWWDLKTRARERNIGWRLDYFFVSPNLQSRLSDAFILADVTGSDHCPVGIDLDI